MAAPRGSSQDEAQRILDRWNECDSFSQARWEDYYNNYAFYEDRQYQNYDPHTNSYTSSPIEDEQTKKIYMVSNLIKPLANTRMAMILAERPMLDVVAEDHASAIAIDQSEKDRKILHAIWDDLNIMSLMVHTIKWTTICNHAFWRPRWDATVGKQIANPKYDQGERWLAEQMGQEYNEPEVLNTGNIRIDLFNPFEVQFDTAHKTWLDVRKYGWVLFKTIQKYDYLLRNYKRSQVERLEFDSAAVVSTVEDKLLQLIDYSSRDSREHDKRRDGKPANVEMWESYEAPSSEYPDGLHQICAGGEILYDSRDTDEKIEKIPVFMFYDQPGNPTLWGKSLISGSRQKQKFYNFIMSQIAEYTRLPVGYGIPEGSGIDVDSWLSKSYEIFKFDGTAGTPIVLQPAPFNQALLYLANKIEYDIEHHWGIHEPTNRPSSVEESGRAFFLKTEKDMSRLNTTMLILGDTLSDVGDYLLDLAREHMKDERTLFYEERGNQWKPITFVGSTDISAHRKVKVVMGSSFQRNKQAYQTFVVNLLGVVQNIPAVAKVLNDPAVMHRILSYIDEELANTLLMRNQSMEVQERENIQLMNAVRGNGEFPKVQPWHEHEVHVQVLMTLLNSVEFSKLPQESQQAIIDKHLVKHLMNIQNRITAAQLASPEQGGGVFKQAGTEAPNPLNAIDQRIEKQVQPQGGLPGGEATGGF